MSPRLALQLLLLVLPLVPVAGCSGGDEAPRDAGAADAGPGPRPDAGPLPGAVFDTGSTWPPSALGCPAGPVRREGRSLGAQRRFALSVLHYNVQYVAGGMDNFRVAGSEIYDGWDDDRIQDAIVTESLMPVLDLLERHPAWTLTLEMQGYMVEVLLARHRDVAQRLVDLVAAGGVELSSFHYSDQLFLAFPRRHMEVSREINRRVLAAGCLRPSGPVFTQEGQFGEGVAAFMTEGVGLLPKNLFRHFQGDVSPAPLYESHGTSVVVSGRDVTDAASGFEVRWVYADDAELLTTGDINPYFPDFFVHDPAEVAAFEARLEALETEGWAIAGVGDYLATLQEAGVAPLSLPAILDGTWQPDDTGNLARWMGDGGLFSPGEQDNEVLTRNARAGRLVLAAEVALAAVRAAGVTPAVDADARLDRAWRDLLLGEVSDATGWNPITNEIEYAFWHAEAAASRGRGLALEAGGLLGLSPPFVVDTAMGTVVSASSVEDPVLEPAAAPPLDVVIAPVGREVEVLWERVRDEPDHYVLTLDIGATPGEVRASFPWELDSLRYTPALLDGEVVEVPLAGLAFTETAVAAGSGPVGLRDDLWLVPDTAAVHLAIRFDRAARTASFRDLTLPMDATARWRFHVVTGPVERALAVADAVNLHPRVSIDAP